MKKFDKDKYYFLNKDLSEYQKEWIQHHWKERHITLRYLAEIFYEKFKSSLNEQGIGDSANGNQLFGVDLCKACNIDYTNPR